MPIPRRRDPDDMRELQRLARDYKRRADALERAQEELRRDATTRSCGPASGASPQTTIAETLGVSQQLVSIVIRSRRRN